MAMARLLDTDSLGIQSLNIVDRIDGHGCVLLACKTN